MLVRQFEPRDLHSLLQLWNATLAPALPQCHQMTEQELLQELPCHGPAAAGSCSGTDARGASTAADGFTQHVGQRRLEHRTVLVAVGSLPCTEGAEGDTETLVGWVDCGVDPAHTGTGRRSLGSPSVQFEPRGMIRWLWFVPGQRRVGEALIAAAEMHLTQHIGMDDTGEILAFDDAQTYHCYHIGHAYLSDRANHIHALLESRGYRRYESELFYAWRNFAISHDDVDDAVGKCRVGGQGATEFELSFEAVPGRGKRPNGILRLLRAQSTTHSRPESGVHSRGDDAPPELLGICECLSAGERFSHSDAQDWFLISWLGVPPNPKPMTTPAAQVQQSASGSNHSYANHPSQGQGLGKLALTAAMYYMRHELGYTHAAISTRGIATDLTGPGDTNSRAQSFYSNFGGFKVEDFTYGLRRQSFVAAAKIGTASI
eukprot:COSAG02_NODE_5465_length_4299_cov_6.983095_4_plen_431_part_00